MKSKLQVVEVLEAEQASVALPEHVQLSLAGIAGQAKEGLLALAVRTSLAVQHKTLGVGGRADRRPEGKPDRCRIAKRHGHTKGEVTLGGRRDPISRPRVRSADDSDGVALDSYQEFASRDLLGQVMLERAGGSAALRPS